MSLEAITRQDMPFVEVYVQQPDRSLQPASEMLADDVREDLTLTRARILNAFGERRLPLTGNAEAVFDFFDKKGWSIPPSVVIDPAKQALGLRSILQLSRFRSPSDEEFFTGAAGAQISPGGSSHRDIVIFHDWKTKYARKLQERVESWGYRISDDEIARTAELKCEEFALHEFVHLAGGLAVSAVTVQKVNGKHQLIDRGTAGFASIEQDAAITEASLAGDTYAGPALDEGWAARNASEYILSREGHQDRHELPLAAHYYVSAVIRSGEASLKCPLIEMHSGHAGIILDALVERQPELLTIMSATASGKHSTRTAIKLLKSHVPARIFNLLLRPDYAAWQKLSAQLGVAGATA